MDDLGNGPGKHYEILKVLGRSATHHEIRTNIPLAVISQP